MAEIIKMGDEQILRNVRKYNLDKAKAIKMAQQALDAERVKSGKFNTIKGFDKLKAG